MPVKLSAAAYLTYTLEYTDLHYENEGDPTYVIVRKARQREHETRQQLFSTFSREYNQSKPNSYTVIQNAPLEELKRLEVWLTLCECNILGPEDKTTFRSKKDAYGNPVLDMTEAEFNEAWNSLPPDVANDIHSKVLEANIVWSGLGE
jgi:hypothetical protein